MRCKVNYILPKIYMNPTLFRSRLDFKLPPIVGYVFLIPPEHHQFRTKTREQRRKLRKQSIKRIFPPVRIVSGGMGRRDTSVITRVDSDRGIYSSFIAGHPVY